jgi:hypothetical protein
MRRIAGCSIALAVTLAVPANAKPPHPQKPAKSKDCVPHEVGYKARGTLVDQALSQTAGADTRKRGDDRYSGTVTVDVKKANHAAPRGMQTYTVESARVHFYDADRDHVADTPKAGDRVKVHGKITKLRKQCETTGFTPTVTVRKVDFKTAKAPKAGKHPKAPKRHASPRSRKHH